MFLPDNNRDSLRGTRGFTPPKRQNAECCLPTYSYLIIHYLSPRGGVFGSRLVLEVLAKKGWRRYQYEETGIDGTILYAACWPCGDQSQKIEAKGGETRPEWQSIYVVIQGFSAVYLFWKCSLRDLEGLAPTENRKSMALYCMYCMLEGRTNRRKWNNTTLNDLIMPDMSRVTRGYSLFLQSPDTMPKKRLEWGLVPAPKNVCVLVQVRCDMVARRVTYDRYILEPPR